MCGCFEQWGLPQRIKVDNGKPFGDPQRSSVPAVALWLIGLGIETLWNRPATPRDNAKVERMQATTSRWVEIQSCASYAQLQSKLDKAAQIQREKYQVKRLGFQSRRQCYGELWNNTRKYCREAFDMVRVSYYLSQVVFVRKVSQRGLINFYGQSVYVGYIHRGKTVSLHYDVQKQHFIIEQQSKVAIACLQADNFSKENIIALTVCQNNYIKCRNFMSFAVAKT